MKIRTGYVSNSSSSSFVLIGYTIDIEYYDDPYDQIDEIASKHGFDCLFGGDDGLETDQIAVGRLYTMSTEGDDDTVIVDIQNLLKEVEAVTEHCKVDGDVKLITGIRMS